jgi:hypothetical protein
LSTGIHCLSSEPSGLSALSADNALYRQAVRELKSKLRDLLANDAGTLGFPDERQIIATRPVAEYLKQYAMVLSRVEAQETMSSGRVFAITFLPRFQKQIVKNICP